MNIWEIVKCTGSQGDGKTIIKYHFMFIRLATNLKLDNVKYQWGCQIMGMIVEM